jgi:WD40 repeat protein
VIKVWDVQEKACIQTIATNTFYGSYTVMIALPFKDNFLIASKRSIHFNPGLYQFSNTQHTANTQYKRRRNKPISASFNNYFSSLMITTEYDIRMYNCFTGKLDKVFVGQRIIQSDNEKINAFSEGALQRKYYTADHKGTIECFNSLNGEHIKIVNDAHDEQEAIKRIAEMLNTNLNKKDNELQVEDPVSCMSYYGPDNKLVVGTYNSLIKFYEEADAESTSVNGVGL